MQEKLPNYVVPDLTDFKVCIFHSFNLIAIFVFCSPVFLQHTMLTFTCINSFFNSLSFIGIVWVSYGSFYLNFSLSPLHNGQNHGAFILLVLAFNSIDIVLTLIIPGLLDH